MKKSNSMVTETDFKTNSDINENLEIYKLIFTDSANYQTKEYQNRLANLIKYQAIRKAGLGGWTILRRVCDICGNQLPSAQHLVPHRFTHTFDHKYSCLVCHEIYDEKTSLSKHLPQHKRVLKLQIDTVANQEKKLLSCNICKKSFTKKYNLSLHKTQIHNVQPGLYICEVHGCGQDFPNIDLRDEHNRSHDCPVCFKTFNRVKYHVRQIHDRKHKCDVCNKGFETETLYNEHKRKHSCSVCLKTFKHVSNCTAHERIHQGDVTKEYECDICTLRFRTSTKLNVHRRGHTGEKPYECGICPKRFTRAVMVREHRATHSGDPGQYKCDLCDKRFYYSASLNNHKIVHTDRKPYECERCKKRFKFASGVHQHKRAHHGNNDEKH